MRLNLDEVLTELEQARQADVDEQVANALFRVGAAYLQHKQPEAAAEALDEAHYLCRKLDNALGRAQVELKLAEVALAGGELGRAERWLLAALDGFEGLEDRAGVVNAMEGLGRVYEAAERLEAAVDILAEALALVGEAGDWVSQLLLYHRQAPLLRRLGRVEEALTAYRGLAGAASAVKDPQRLALAQVGVGTALCELGRTEEGVAALADAAGRFEALGQVKRAEQVRAEAARLTEKLD